MRDLLFLEVIKSTNFSAPKNSTQINEELERRWGELFPDVPFPKMGLKTIINHIADMKASGLYDVRVHDNTRLGYYNVPPETDKPVYRKNLFDIAEIVVITTALFRSPTVSQEFLQRIMKHLEAFANIDGETYLFFLKRQIKLWGTTRKTRRDIFPVVSRIWDILMTRGTVSHQIKFLYLADDIYHTVSPYFFVWESDELYLIAHEENFGFKHFKVVLIENVGLSEKYTTFIQDTEEYAHYVSNGSDRGGLAIGFPLDKYTCEHVYMSDGNTAPIDITIRFRTDFKDTVLTRFGTDLEICAAEDDYCNATITAQENDGLYQWLMQFGDKICVVSPDNVREKLKQKLLAALELQK